MKRLAVEIPHMADSDVWCQNNALSSMQIKHILIIRDIHSSFTVCLSRILKGILSVMYCQQLTPSAKGESSCLFCCWKGSDPKRESERAQEKAKLFFRHFKTKLQTLSALREMDETLPPAVTFVATGQRRGGSPGQGSKPEAHVAFGMGTLEWELALSLLHPRHQVSVPCDKTTGFPWQWWCHCFGEFHG